MTKQRITLVVPAGTVTAGAQVIWHDGLALVESVEPILEPSRQRFIVDVEHSDEADHIDPDLFKVALDRLWMSTKPRSPKVTVTEVEPTP